MNNSRSTPLNVNRGTLLAWIRSLLPDLNTSTQIQELGKGVIYCRIINQFFPGSIFLNRIIWVPKSEYECLLNLKILQNTMLQLKLNITFDPSKIAKEKSQQNLMLASAFYKHFNSISEEISFDQKLVYGTGAGTGVKRQIESTGVQHLYYQSRSPYIPPPRQYPGKFSVGRLQPNSNTQKLPSPTKGKWSVNSHVFQNNLIPVIDRVKQILLKSAHDTQKIRQVKMLLNIPLNQDIVKVEQDEIDTQIIQVTGIPVPINNPTNI